MRHDFFLPKCKHKFHITQDYSAALQMKSKLFVCTELISLRTY